MVRRRSITGKWHSDKEDKVTQDVENESSVSGEKNSTTTWDNPNITVMPDPGTFQYCLLPG